MIKSIKGLLIKPDGNPEVVEVSNSLESLQSIVDGYIEMVCPPSHEDDVVIIANEEAKILGLEMNRPLKLGNGSWYDVVCGNMLLVRAPFDSEDFESLTDEQIKTYTDMYYTSMKDLNGGLK